MECKVAAFSFGEQHLAHTQLTFSKRTLVPDPEMLVCPEIEQLAPNLSEAFELTVRDFKVTEELADMTVVLVGA